MPKTTTLFSLVATTCTFLSLVSTAPASLESPAAAQGPVVVPGAYIVEFEDGHDHASFYNSIGRRSIEAIPRMSLSHQLFNGASFWLQNTTHHEEIAEHIAQSPEVKKMWPVHRYRLPNDKVHWTAENTLHESPASLHIRQPDKADTWAPHRMTQVDRLRADGVTGKGIKVAVIDTGIDYLHPALGGGFGPGFLVSYGKDLVGDQYSELNPPVPDDDPMDECDGHGTHVAGIIAAQPNQFGFTGTAPDVTLGAYRVFGCDKDTTSDVLIAAVNQAYEDGSDIITASLGQPSGWSEDPWAVAMQRIVEAGVPITVCAHNIGAQGIFSSSDAASSKGTISIASVDNLEIPLRLSNATFTTTATSDNTTFGWLPGQPFDWGNASLPLFSGSLNTSEPADACTPYPDSTADLSAYIVLIRRSASCYFTEQIKNAAAKGAKRVMFYNNVPGLDFTYDEVSGLSGVGMVSSEQGAKWIELLAAGSEVTLNIVDPSNASHYLDLRPNNATGGFMSTFTAWGPTFQLDSRPGVAAIGGNVFSTYPRALGSWANLSGTSMSTPQVAAVIALIMQARGTKDPRVIETLLYATANPQLFNNGNTTSPFLAPIAQQGGGLIKAYDAVHSITLLSTSFLALNDSAHFFKKTEFSIKNTGTAEVTYKLGHVNAATAYTFDAGSVNVRVFPNELTPVGASLSFCGLSENAVSVGPGKEVTVEVEFTQPTGLDATRLPVYSGYITLNATATNESLSLPYLGVAGNMYDTTVLSGGRIRGSSDISDKDPISNGTVFTFPKNGNSTGPPRNGTTTKYPNIMPNLVFGTRSLLMDVVPADNATGTHGRSLNDHLGVMSIGQVFTTPLEYLPRGGPTVQWDGKLADKSYAPAGQYKIITRALRIFGDPEKPEDFMSWESVPFGIKYA